MSIHREKLPQLENQLFLTDAGMETDLIFNRGLELPAFAAHTALASASGRAELRQYFSKFLDLAARLDRGFILDVPTWRAQRFFAAELECEPSALKAINQQAVDFGVELRRDYATNKQAIVLNAAIGPRGDAYAPDNWITADESLRYHSEQLEWLAETDIDMVSALTFTNAAEAIGVVKAASRVNLPIAVSFTVETNGRLPTGQSLADAIDEVDTLTQHSAQYFMLNCAHPSHLAGALEKTRVRDRIRGLRCNASRMSHAELDCCETLDDGDPAQLAEEYRALLNTLPELRVLGGCCGTDIRHVTAIAEALDDIRR